MAIRRNPDGKTATVTPSLPGAKVTQKSPAPLAQKIPKSDPVKAAPKKTPVPRNRRGK